jgi:Na+/proline symporter
VISAYDYLNIGFYFAFVVGVGIWFARKSRDTSDYFRAGGVLPWWITGSSAWMASFSAWTFTGAAAKIYETGTYVLCLYYSTIVPLVALYFLACFRFRRLRVVTPLEGLRLRFGVATQQFYTWVRLPVTMVFSAFGLTAVGVFMAAIFHTDVVVMLVLLGAAITLLSVLGGALGVAASDFVQMLIVVAVTVVVAIRALALPEIGGLGGLVERAPAAHLEWGRIARPEYILLWFAALTLNTTLGRNSLADDSAAKYMSTRSDRDARLMVLIPLVGTVVGPILWFIPPMVAAVVHPHLASEYSVLRYPNEAAFLATARDVLPQGMLGLLVCAMFASTLSTMDARVNQGAGIFVRNFYLPMIDPHCPERRLLFLSKIVAALMGASIIVLATVFDRYREHGLFDLLNQVGVSIALPLEIPACLGLFYRRTPAWSGWSTVMVGFLMSVLASFWLAPEMIAGLPRLGGTHLPEERTIFTLVATVVLTTGVASSWFFATSFFYERSPATHRQSVDEFFRRLHTPLDEPSAGATENRSFPATVGRLALWYGAFVTLFVLIPNSATGRLCYVAVGGTMILIGAVLIRRYRQPIAPTEGVFPPR